MELPWNILQNSVFEGEISEVRLKEMILRAKEFMNADEDSIILFKGKDIKWMEKKVVGVEKVTLINFYDCRYITF